MEDNHFIALLQERSPTAIPQLQEEYGNYIYKIAFGVLRNREDSEECLNDVLLKIWQSIPPDMPTFFKAYIGTLTRNLSLDQYRRQSAQKRQGASSTLLEESALWVSDDATISEHQLSQSISTYLEKLPHEKQSIFLARYYYGYTVEEIAVKLRISQSKVKTTLFRMRKTLQKALEKEGVVL